MLMKSTPKCDHYAVNNYSLNQVGNAIDAWEKFLELHDSVMTWCSEKQALVSFVLKSYTMEYIEDLYLKKTIF